MSKYTVKATSQFKKDYKLAKKRGKNTKLLDEVTKKLADGERLPEKHYDHPLSGNWEGHRECHVQPDWLLVYYKVSRSVGVEIRESACRDYVEGDDKLMTKLSPTNLHYYDCAVTDLIMDKYGFSRMDALRKFVESQTHALLEDAENGMTAFGAAGVFDIWESEMITGDPRNSIYIRGD